MIYWARTKMSFWDELWLTTSIALSLVLSIQYASAKTTAYTFSYEVNKILSDCNSPAKPTITSNGPTTLCSGGSVILTASAGKSYLWSNGETTQTISVSKEGPYTVTVTDHSGYTAKSDTIIVSVNTTLAPPLITTDTKLIVCEAGSVILTVPAQQGATYVWRKNGVAFGYNSNRCEVNESGVYTVELSNFCGKVRSSNAIEYKVKPRPSSFNIKTEGATTICLGGAVKLSIEGQKDATYTWKKDGLIVGTGHNEFYARQSGSYTVEMETVCGIFTSANAITVDVLALPNAPTISLNKACSGSIAQFKAAGSTDGNYRWYIAATGGNPLPGAVNAVYTAKINQTTTYYVAITNGKCESSRTPVTVTAVLPPVSPVITVQGRQKICKGETTILQVPEQNGVEYIWKKDGQPIGTNTNKLTVTEAGKYTLGVKNECDLVPASNQINIEVVPVPSVPVAHDMVLCGSGSVTLTASGGAKGDYRWYESESAPNPIAGETDNTYQTPVLHQNRTYYVALNSNGCESRRVAVQVTIGTVPTAHISSSVTLDFGESTILKGSGGTNYSWSPVDGLDNPTSPNPIARPLQTTTYTLTVTNESGCKDSAQVEIIVRKDLIIPNAFSPNGDGINDKWEIQHIETYPDAKIEVYNRWGNKVFEKVKYDNIWNGTYRGALLPVSTYFYVITFPKGRQLTGSVSIVE